MLIRNQTSNLHKYLPRLLEVPIKEVLEKYPVVALLGPRQCGKSTMAMRILAGMGRAANLDLERPSDRAGSWCSI